MINQKELERVVKKYEAIIRKDLGIEDMDVTIHVHKGLNDENKLGCIYYTKYYRLLTITSVEDRVIHIYPDMMMKSALYIVSKKELEGLVIETLAHELRHAYQTSEMVGSPSFSFNSLIPDKDRPEEVDAREYATKFIQSVGITPIDRIVKRNALIIDSGIVLMVAGVSLLIKKIKGGK